MRCDRLEMYTLSVLRHKKIKFSYRFGEMKGLIWIKASRHKRESQISLTASINFSFHFHFVASLKNVYYFKPLFIWFDCIVEMFLSSYVWRDVLLWDRLPVVIWKGPCGHFNQNLKRQAIYSYIQLVLHSDSPGLKAWGNLLSTETLREFRFMF